jgi:organic radical activating enzyme
MQKIKLDTYLSVVVNNLCNLTCSHCGGLACYDFTGNFAWKDSADRFEKWAEYLDTDNIAFAGGEMFLHPNLDEWFINMRRLWPNAHIEVPTNGSKLTKRLDLVNLILNDGNAHLRVSCHYESEDEFQKLKKHVFEVLQPWEGRLTIVEDEYIPTKQNRAIKFFLGDKMILRYEHFIDFYQPYHHHVENGTVHFHMGGDQDKSFENCIWHTEYNIQHGLMYHCPAVTNYPEAKLQVKYVPEAQEVLERYKACDPHDGYDVVKKFIEHDLKHSIEVCKLCAFDKQKDPMVPNIRFKIDPNFKKKFRSIPIKPI